MSTLARLATAAFLAVSTFAALLVLPYGAWSAPGKVSRRQELEAWTRHYERVMGLPTLVIDFREQLDPQSHCAHVEFTTWITRGGLERKPGVVYSLSAKCERAWSAQELALHECLHWRLQHPYLPEMARAAKEREVAMFRKWYVQ